MRLLQRRTAVFESEFVKISPLLRIRKLKHETLARDYRCKKDDDNRERTLDHEEDEGGSCCSVARSCDT
jgi:hypothetical protein